MPEAIRRVKGYGEGAYTYYPVVVVGAGESGIAMAVRLKTELGFDQFRLFDRQAGIGGTWWINRYPGVACDVPAVFYSFSFAPNPNWTKFFPDGPEIVHYLHDVCEKYQITDKIELNTDVSSCRWLEDEQLWEVELRHLVHGMGDLSAKDRQRVQDEQGAGAVVSSTETIRAKMLISGVGGLVEPAGVPRGIPGFETFQGPVFHSARWDYSVDMTDKNVLVVGTGCSAAQFVPSLTKAPYNAKSVTQLMRSPPWVCPRIVPPGGNEWWEANSRTLITRVPGFGKLVRWVVAGIAESAFIMFGSGKIATWSRKASEKELLRHMKKTVPAKYHDMLTPDYGVGCKRRVFDATWFPGLNDSKIELTTQPLTRVQEDGVVIGPGSLYAGPGKSEEELKALGPERKIDADIIVLANGFEAYNWFHPLEIIGRDGKTLYDVWDERGGPQAYLGAAMDGFPNMFFLFGPNTATGHSSVILASENMVNFSLKFMEPVLKGDVQTVEVKKEAEIAYTADIQDKLKDTIWMKGGCSSWYHKDGWNSTVLPYSQVWFLFRCMFPRYGDFHFNYTSKGLWKLRLSRATKLLLLTLACVGTYRARQVGLKLADLKGFLRVGFGFALDYGIQALSNAKSVVSGA
ncbi:FAD/NAD(P)-binding domain-containing protein [Eremomyces bilateralis CBS 781.70]|uniref:FAD/NAD(P)-binding domain-containing protein n=1 Tax=Eremomyces bilateralis CBS 781.70 TaxID=1392243 RepID=A0A6G1G8H4_9PEZI|nr:FAD/NAD(P)-binding domain-containing protein [Eremomyces bilateralis CBS 781.70]KAF1814221.1 FAD/NAD(P)-binding domain-containing protein [Eremomyces bilateralis CBS 781.70]